MMIRPMQESDLPRILEIEHSCFIAPWAPQSFISELRDNEYARYFCLEYEGEVIGYMGLWFILEEGHITNVAVHPRYQGMGRGEFLMSSVINLMAKEGMESMTLEVRTSNAPAQKLYERLGFVIAGVRKGYYSDNREDAIIMWLHMDKN